MKSNTVTGRYIGLPVKVKKLDPNAVIPKYAHYTDAGLDLTATSKTEHEDYIEYGTGLAFEIPEGYVGLIYPRSSVYKQDLLLSNSVGVVDSAYRGEVRFMYKKTKEDAQSYNIGDRIGQLIIMPYPQISLIESDTLSDSDRGINGFGSTGK